MAESARYCVNTPKITHEIIDSEVVIINFDSGNYYSIDDTGAYIWERFQFSPTIFDLINACKSQYKGKAKEIEQSIQLFTEELLKERLIVKCDGDPSGATTPTNNHETRERQPFSKPKLEIYKDMQDLLLLDPIHEVDESGWPRVKPDQESNTDLE